MMKKHMVQRSLTFIALSGMLACASDPTGDFKGGVESLQATPTTVFVTEGTTETVDVVARDAAGNPVETTFSIGTVGAGITVVRDESFEPIRNDDGEFVPNPHPTRVRYQVTTTASTANSSFTINAGGESVTINARNLPDTASVPQIAFSATNTANGTPVTLTLTAPYRFSASSVITFDSGAAAPFLAANRRVAFKSDFSDDSSTVTIFAAPGVTARAATVTNIRLTYAPTQIAYTRRTSNALTTPALPTATFTKAAGPGDSVFVAVGDTVSATLPAPFKFTPGAAGTAVTGFGNALVDVSADSSTIRFIAGPSANAAASFSAIKYSGAPAFADFTMTTGTTRLRSPAIANFAGTFSNASPARNDTVTLTAPAGFKFLATATVTVGGQGGLVISNNATTGDSTQIRFVAPPGATAGVATGNGVVLSFLRTVSLTLPTVATITPAGSLAGATTVATAPTIALPAVGQSVTFYDGGPFTGSTAATGGVGNRFYRITVPAATSVTVSMTWNNTADIDILYGNAAGGGIQTSDPCLAGATGANPEAATCTMATGDNTLFANIFAGTAPGVIRITLTRNN